MSGTREPGGSYPARPRHVALRFAVSIGLRIYLNYFDTYSTVYGALDAVLILLLWIVSRALHCSSAE
jgi:hypothetical protein